MDDRKKQVYKSFSDHALEYEFHAALQKKCAVNLAGFLPLLYGDVLEIGCGTGFLTYEVLQRFPEIRLTASDISESMLDRCKKNMGAAVNYELLDGENLNPGKKYHSIISGLAFQWFVNLENSLQTIISALKPGGVLGFSCLHSASFPEWRAKCKELNIPYSANVFPEINQLKKILPSVKIQQESVQFFFNHSLEFFKSLKKIGAGVSLHSDRVNPKQLQRLLRSWDNEAEVSVTYEIAYCFFQNKNE